MLALSCGQCENGKLTMENIFMCGSKNGELRMENFFMGGLMMVNLEWRLCSCGKSENSELRMETVCVWTV